MKKMKKIFLFVVAIAFLGVGLFAQTTTAPKKNEKPKAATAAPKKAEKPTPAATTKVAPTKADGTPDMRYKVNKAKEKIKTTGPKKADGTPDLRYKANKPAAKKKSA